MARTGISRPEESRLTTSCIGTIAPLVAVAVAVAVAALPAWGWAASSDILEKAARGIETHRKGDAVVRVVCADGSVVPGAKVEVILRSHDFLFGNLFRPRHYNNEKYRAKFLELFNFIQLLEFNWGQYENEEGKPELDERMEFIKGWCSDNGLTKFYFHMLVWTAGMEEKEGWQVPPWLLKYDKAAQYDMLKKRIQRDVAAYKDIDVVWDVVNEAVHCRVWGDWDKDGYIQNKQAEPIERILPYVKDSLAWAHEAHPEAKLLINDYYVVPKSRFQGHYKRLLDALQARKSPLTAVGIQAHEPNKGAYWFSPEEIWDACELFGTRTGLPIYFTELWYVSDRAKDIRGTHRQGKWSPALQAEATEEFYRVAFGHPAVASIIYFGMSDNDPPGGIATSCLLDEKFQPKPAWNRLNHLLKEEWTTRQSGSTDAAGAYAFRGFYGQYDVRVTAAGRQRTFKTHLEKGKPSAWRLVLD